MNRESNVRRIHFELHANWVQWSQWPSKTAGDKNAGKETAHRTHGFGAHEEEDGSPVIP